MYCWVLSNITFFWYFQFLMCNDAAIAYKLRFCILVFAVLLATFAQWSRRASDSATPMTPVLYDVTNNILASQRVFWATVRQTQNHTRVTCVGRSGENINKKRPYISRISVGAPLRPIGTNFGLRVRLVGMINCAKFYRSRLRGLDSVRGRISTIPIVKLYSLTHSLIGLRCRR